MIEILADAKQIGDEIAVRKAESEVTEKEIDRIRESFRSVAYRASILFFAIVDMCQIDPMYHYSGSNVCSRYLKRTQSKQKTSRRGSST